MNVTTVKVLVTHQNGHSRTVEVFRGEPLVARDGLIYSISVDGKALPAQAHLSLEDADLVVRIDGDDVLLLLDWCDATGSKLVWTPDSTNTNDQELTPLTLESGACTLLVAGNTIGSLGAAGGTSSSGLIWGALGGLLALGGLGGGGGGGGGNNGGGNDTTAQIPVLNKILLTASVSEGSDTANGYRIVNNPLPVVSGSTQSGATVTVTFSDGQTVSTIADLSGNWQLSPNTPLADGITQFTATARNALGESATPVGGAVLIDTTAPDLPDAQLDFASDSGTIGDLRTVDTTPEISGSAATPRDTITVVTPAGELLTATVSPDGSWTVTPTNPLPLGTNAIAISATDAAGNVSAIATVTIIVDPVPMSPTVNLASGSDTGVASDNITDVTLPTITGVGAEPGQSIFVIMPSGEELAGVVALDGTWSVTPTIELSDGVGNVVVTAGDSHGNLSAPSILVLTIDTTAPETPSPILDDSSDTGNSGDGITNDTTPRVSGNGSEPGDTVLVTMPTGETLETLVGSDGSWSITPSVPLNDGNHTISAIATDSIGHTSGVGSVVITVDTSTPPAPIAALDVLSNTGLPTDNITAISTPTIIGSGAIPGNQIQIITPTGEVLTTTVTGDGSWLLTPTVALTDGTNDLIAAQIDGNGHAGPTTTVSVVIDTTPPSAPVAIIDPTSDTGSIGNLATSDTTPTISGGGATPGDSITVTTPIGDVLTAVVDASGNWSVTPTVPLPEGNADFTITATDIVGNTSAATVLTITIDVTSSVTPGAQLDIISDTGSVGDSVTSDTMPTISGTGANSGDTIIVTTPTGEVVTTLVDPAGNWSATPSTSLPDGNHTFAIVAADPAGNISAPTTLALTIDTNAPDAPAATLSVSSDSGLVGDSTTNDTTPSISGSSTGIGNTITVTTPSGEVLRSIIDPLGNWSVTTGNSLPSGNNSFVVTESDIAGNTSLPTTVSVIIDTTAPSAPNAQLDTASDTGVNGDLTTSDTTPTVSGSGANPGDTITVTAPSGETLTVVADSTGVWSVTASTPLTDGNQIFIITATDSTGNVSAPTTLGIVVDTTAPSSPIAILSPATDSGVIGDGITNDTTPTVSGNGATPGDTITVTTPTGEALTTTVDIGGNWVATPTQALPDGANNIAVTATDPAGNVSGSSTLMITVDSAAPGAPTAQLDFSSDSGTVGDSTTNDTTPRISGSGANPGDTIGVITPSGESLTTVVDASGNWFVDPTVALGEGSNSFSVSAIDVAGNVSATTSVVVIIDTSSPSGPLADLATTSDSGVIGDRVTSDTTPNISGSNANPGDIVSVSTPAGEVLSVTVSPDGTWTVSPSIALPDGDNTFSITATDTTGNVSPVTTLIVAIDTAAPGAPSAGLSIASDSGAVGDSVSNDTTPEIAGSGAGAGNTITVTTPNGEVLTATVDSLGNWAVTPTVPLLEGGNDFSVNATDIAGNKSGDTAVSITIDSVAPAAPAALLAPASDTGTPGDSITATDTPMIIGNTATPGDIITVITPVGETLTAVVDSSGSWGVSPNTPLPDGAHSFAVTATDPAGNTSAISNVVVTVDTSAPSTPAPQLDLSSDTGTVGDSTTTDTTPTISGLGATPGHTITLTTPTGEILTTIVDNAGLWSVTPTMSFPEGSSSVSATETDSAGNISAAGSMTVLVDTSAPNSPLGILAVGSDTGTIGDGITNDTTPMVRGSNATPGDTITIITPTSEILTTTVDTNGNWVVTPTQALPDGANNIAVTATDPAGNVSGSSTLTITVDSVAPGAPPAQLDSASDSGTVGDSITNDTTPRISGSGANPGDTIGVVTTSGEALTTVVDASGNWFVDPTAALGDGDHSFSVSAIDAAGNISAATLLNVTIDTSGPGAPAAVLDISSDTGALGDSTTSDNTPSISGSTATPGDTITVTTPTGEVLTATVDAIGNWFVTPTASISDGSQNFSVNATDSSGNVGPNSTLSVFIDTAAPPAPTASLAPVSDTGTIGDNTSNENTPAIAGNGAAPGDTMTVTTPSGEVLTTVVDSLGNWTVSPTTPLPDGNNVFAVFATDPAGNQGSASTATVIIDTSPPSAPAAQLDPSADSGVLGDSITIDTTPTVSGNGATPGDVITLTSPTGEILSSIVDASGHWSATPTTPLTDGNHGFLVSATDSAGNISSNTSVMVTVDTTPPLALTPILDPSSDSGVIGDSTTSDSTPTLSGVDATPGDTISVTTPVGEILTTVVDAAGTWMVTPTAPIPNGTNAYHASATDAAGNISATSTVSLVVDTIAPAAPNAVLDPISDTGIIGDGSTNQTTPTISGSGANPGNTVEVVTPVGEILTTLVNGDGDWAVTPTTALPEGANSVTATATDRAGNTSTNTVVTFIIDTTAPGSPSAFLHPSSDSGIAGDGTTNDSTPSIAGNSANPGDIITVTSPTGEVLTAIIDTNGDWLVTPANSVPDGDNDFSIVATDVTGNTSAPTTLTITVNTAAPNGPAAQLDLSSDSGSIGDSITSDTTPTISGSSQNPGNTITVTTPAGESLTALVDSSGDWRVTPTIALANGNNNLTVVAVDPIGNTSPTTNLAIVIDTTAPSTPVATLAPVSDTGSVGDGITNNTTPSVSGSGAAPGDTITIVTPTGEVLNTIVDTAGHWIVTPTQALPDGANSIAVTATDPAGNVSSSSTLTITVDSTAPSAPPTQLDMSSDSGTIGDSITSDTTPRISGFGANPGDTIGVITPTGEALTTVVDASGNWFVDPTVAIDEGTSNFSVSAIDAAGNIGATTTLNVTIDTSGPGAPTAVLDVSSDSGIPGDNITSDSTPSISGSVATPGNLVTVTAPNGELLTALVDSSGNWIVTPTTVQNEGSADFTVNTTDVAGNVSSDTTVSVIIDTSAPAAPVGLLSPASDSGLQGDGSTNDSTPTLSGSGANPGDTIGVISPSGETLTATVDSSGNWSVTPTSALSDGTNNFTLSAIDAAGNVGPSAIVSVYIDTSAPGVPNARLDISSDAGALGDSTTNDTTPNISGTSAAPGDTISVMTPTGEILSATVDASGGWSVTPTQTFSEGSNTVTVNATDPSGNAGASTAIDIIIDTTAPIAPTAMLDPSSDSGISGDSTSNSATPAISGNGATPGDTISVTTPVGETLTTLVNSAGQWIVTPSTPIPDGINTFDITATDPTGNVSVTSDVAIFIDTVAPSAPAALLGSSSDSGIVGDRTTNDSTPVIAGTDAAPGDRISIITPSGETLTTIVDGAGNWSVTPSTPFTDGNHDVSITATDRAGNVSAVTTLNLTIDTTEPTAPNAQLDVSSDTGVTGDNTTSDTTPSISGSGANPGDEITVTTPSGEVVTSIVDASGNWIATPTSGLNTGNNTFTVFATDPAGNESPTATVTVIIDDSAPAAPVATLDPSSDSGSLGDSTTNDTTPTISGSGASPNDTITVLTPTGEVLNALVAANGSWSVTPANSVTQGSQNFLVTATNPAGNTGATTTVTVVIDTTPPFVPFAVLDGSSDTGLQGDNLTNDATPSISGSTAKPGETITVTTPTGEVLTTVADANGDWLVTPTNAITPGNNDFLVTATDNVGNTSYPYTLSVLLDTNAPVAPPAVLDPASDTGIIGDSTTNSTTPVISGVGASAGDTITVTSPTGEVLTATANNSGIWSVALLVALSEGNQSFSVTATDRAGNVSPTTPLTINVDTSAPASPAAQLSSSSDSGVNGDSITNDNTPTISGDAATPGNTITVTTASGEILSALIDGSGSWSVTPTTALPDGSNDFSVTATDNAGNTSAATIVNVVIDTSGPIAPSAVLDLTSDTGLIGDSLTSDTTPTISGTDANPGDAITVTTPTGEVLTAIASSNGEWTVSPTTALPQGVNTVYVAATDPAGNTGATGTLLITIDTNAPAAPIALLDLVSDSGQLGDSTTNDTTPSISGSGATAGDTITVISPTGEVMSAIVNGSGDWFVTPSSPLSDGANNFSVNATDAAGNVSPNSSLTVTIDTTAPQAPNATLDVSSDSGMTGDLTTNDTTPTISGTTATPGDTIRVVTANNEALTAIVDASGNWSVTPSIALPEGSNDFAVNATDQSGNTGSSTTVSVVIDTTAPNAPAAVLNPVSDSGVLGDNTTNVSTPTVSGSGATPGYTITATTPTGEVLNTTVDNDGNWSLTVTNPLPDGVNSISVTQTDTTGNISSPAAVPILIDTGAPATPSATLDPASDTGTVGDNITADTTPSIIGSGAIAGDTITVTTPAGEVLTTTVAASGNWSITPTIPLDDGSNEFVIIAIDPTGNTSSSTSISVTIDTSASNAPSAILDPISDSGTTGDSITNDTTPRISGGGATPGDTITVLTPSGESLTDTVDSSGNWAVIPTTALPQGSNDFVINATDATGNVSANTTLSVVIDTSAPAAPTATLDPSSDSGTVGDRTTTDSTPTISGANATPGDEITVTTSTGEVLSAIVDADGDWSVTPATALSEGANAVGVTATDPAGNKSSATTLTVIVDTTAPNAPSAVLSNASDSGMLGDSLTNDTTPSISGSSASPGDVITVTAPSGEVLTTTVNSSGNWSVTPAISLAQGSNNFSVVATDPASNTSAQTTVTVVIDTTNPNAPTAELGIASDSGVQGDNITSDTTPDISGSSATPGETITVTTPTGEVLTAIVDTNGNWIVTPSIAIGEGSNEFSVTATDAAGNIGANATINVAIDTTASNPPAMTLDSSSDSGANGDLTTSDTTPTLSGAGSIPGDTITVTTSTGEVLTAVVNAGGNWNATPSVPLPEGINNFSAYATDPAGNASGSSTLTVLIDTTAPNAPNASLDSSSDTGVLGDSITRDTTPAISGTAATPGDTITVTTPSGEELTTTVNSAGNWLVTPTTALPEGSHEFSVTATDPVGLTSAATTVSVLIDTTAPGAPSAILDPASDTGVTGDNTTRDTTPSISGSGATPGDSITVTTPTGEVLTAIVNASGSWVVTASTPLPEGGNNLTVSATDSVGNVSANTTLSILVDTTASSVPVGTLATESDTGTVGDSITNDPTPTIAGDSATPGDTIAVTTPTGEVLTAVVEPNGTWKVIPTIALPNGGNDFAITAIDPAGNISANSTLSIQIDTSAPGAPTAQLDTGSDSGLAGDSITSDTTPTISGSGATAGDTITVTSPTGEVLTAIVDAGGNWSTNLTGQLSEGSNGLTVTATDPAGNTSSATTVTVTIDTTAPLAPAAALDVASDSGVVGDNTTNDTTPIISGSSASPGDTISVSAPSGETLTALVDTNGNWSVTPTTPLANGSASFSINATDAAGNTSANTSATVVIDTTAPAAPTAELASSSDSGTLGDNLSNDTTPTIVGGGVTPGDTITVSTPAGELLTSLVDASGNWAVTPIVPLSDGLNNFTVRASDPSGNIGAATTLGITIDTVAPAAVAAILDVASDSGVVGDTITNDTTPTISGSTASPGDTVTVTMPTGEVLTTLVNGAGDWSVAPSTPLSEGSNAITVTATDPAGNTGPATTTMVSIDTVAPNAPSAQLDPSSDSGDTGDNTTNDTTPTISGSGATVGEIITVTSPTGEVLTTNVDTNGDWSVTPSTSLANGTRNFLVTTTDAAGNTSVATSVAVMIDTSGPSAPPAQLDPSSDSAILGDNTTTDATPTISGATATPGHTITVTTPSGELLTDVVDSNGQWSVTPTTGLSDGLNNIVVTATDEVGNVSPPTTVGVQIDTAAPNAPTASLDTSSDSGNPGDNTTNDTTPSISGSSANPGDTITVSLPTGEVLTTLVSASGNWIVTPTTTLSEGSNSVQVSATDPAGNVSAATTVLVIIDTSPEAAPAAALDIVSDSGLLGDSTTNDTTPTLSGSGAIAGNIITVTTPSGEVLTTTVNAAGFWSVTPVTPLPQGSNNFSVNATDPAGNVSANTVVNVIIDTSAPSAPTAQLDPSSDSGVTGDSTTNDVTPTISGSGATPGDTMTVTTPAGEVITSLVDTNGNWLATPTSALGNGNQVFSVYATDPAGNAGANATVTVLIDTNAPAAPVAQLATSSDSGILGDSITNDTTPTISGLGASPGDSITVMTSAGEMLSTTVDSAGNWNVTPSTPMSEGSNDVTVSATDPAGNVSADSTVSIIIDTTAPAALTAALAITSDSGIVGDSTTADTTPGITGSGATTGDTITATMPTGEILTAVVDSAGNWVITPTSALSEGSNSIVVTATDPAGNTGPGTTVNVIIDTTPPTVPTAELAVSSDSGIAGDGITNDTTPTITGSSAAPGDTVTVTTPSGEVLTTVVDVSGNWTVTPTTPLAQGNNSFAVSTTDPSGNTSATATMTVFVDTTAPVAPNATLDPSSDSGSLGDNRTNDNTPTLSGNSANPGDTITVTTSSGEVLTTQVNSGGNWSVTPSTALPSGNNNFTVSATDVAGNVSSNTNVTVIIDTTPPVAPAASLAIASDSGTLGDNRTNDTTPSISGAGAVAGDTIAVTSPTGEILTVLVDASGSWLITPTVALASGDGDFSVTATDSAGNQSAATTVSVIIDTTAPTAPIAVLDPSSDSGALGDSETNDATPSISGSGATAGDTISVSTPSGEVLTTVVSATGTWLVTPSTAFAEGSNNVLVSATDSAGNVSLNTTLTINVDLTENDSASTIEDTTVTGNVLTNDATGLTVATFSFAGDTTDYSAGSTANLGNAGSISIAANGDYTFTPAPQFSGPVPEITYSVNGAADATLNISVSPVVDQPVGIAPPVIPIIAIDSVPQITAIGTMTQAQIEAVLNEAAGWMDSFNPTSTLNLNPNDINGTTGTLRLFTTYLDAGETFTLPWQFQSSENATDTAAGYEDAAILHVTDPSGNATSTILASSETYLATFPGGPTSADWQTGNSPITATTSGVYEIAIAIFNGRDTAVDSNVILGPWTPPSQTVALNLFALADGDGSEQFDSISITGLPTNALLNNGTDNGGGSWTLTGSDLDGLQLTLPAGYTGAPTITATATSIETSSGDISAVVTETVSLNAVNATAAPVNPTADADTFVGTAGNDYYASAGGDDVISGADADDYLDGQDGDDTISGGAGHDKLLGGDGTDGISGGAGVDVIEGGAGNDTLTGDAGSDLFVWSANDAGSAGTPDADTVTDFQIGVGGDVIVLDDLLNGEGYGNLESYLHFTLSGSDTIINVSSNGGYSAGYAPAQTDLTIQLTGVDLVTPSSGSSSQIINTLLTNGNLAI